jgi:hypothetical protein
LRGFGGGGADRRRNRREDSVKLTNTQRRLLAAASQRDDGALKRPSQLTGGAAGKVVASRLRYPSDLTNDEWALVAPLIPPAKRGGAKRTVDVREVMNGISTS